MQSNGHEKTLEESSHAKFCRAVMYKRDRFCLASDTVSQEDVETGDNSTESTCIDVGASIRRQMLDASQAHACKDIHFL